MANFFVAELQIPNHPKAMMPMNFRNVHPKNDPNKARWEGTFDQRYPPKKGGSRHSLPDTSHALLQTSETSQQHRILNSPHFMTRYLLPGRLRFNFCISSFAGIVKKHVLLLSTPRVPARTPGVGCPIIGAPRSTCRTLP